MVRYGHLYENGIWETPKFPEKIWLIYDGTQKQLIEEQGLLGDEDNVEKPFSERTFCTILRSNETRLGIIYDKNLDGGAGKSARGYRGVSVFINVLDYLRG